MPACISQCFLNLYIKGRLVYAQSISKLLYGNFSAQKYTPAQVIWKVFAWIWFNGSVDNWNKSLELREINSIRHYLRLALREFTVKLQNFISRILSRLDMQLFPVWNHNFQTISSLAKKNVFIWWGNFYTTRHYVKKIRYPVICLININNEF
jgi:hypothetical protein